MTATQPEPCGITGTQHLTLWAVERGETHRLGEDRSGSVLVRGACGKRRLGQPGGECLGELEAAHRPLVDRGQTQPRTIRTRTGLTVPVTITNTGRDRAAYSAEVKITGPQAFEAVLHVGTDGTPLYPGTSRPTELTATDPGKPVPSDPTITITRVTRTPDES
ncbi:hypothetical protein [Streptomyces violaceus]|uniref:CARDB domain-containing protein n=1 Tax=Streptomyces violaceus TaxID=1936 RepID=A0ABZ1NT93_STRVL